MAILRALGTALALLALVALTLPSAPTVMAQGRDAESLALTGLVEKPKTFTQADLAAYPSTTLSVAFGAGQELPAAHRSTRAPVPMQGPARGGSGAGTLAVRP